MVVFYQFLCFEVGSRSEIIISKKTVLSCVTIETGEITGFHRGPGNKPTLYIVLKKLFFSKLFLIYYSLYDVRVLLFSQILL